jgi:hypothetical protein
MDVKTSSSNWISALIAGFTSSLVARLRQHWPVLRPARSKPLLSITLRAVFLSLFTATAQGQAFLDNQTQYSNQDPENETRRSDHFRTVFGYYNRDSTPMTEEMAQGNLQMFEQAWNRWVVEMGLHDINESANSAYVDGNKYRANFNFLMTFNDGEGGGAYSSADAKGFFYAMANPASCRFDPPSGATPHEFGHVWQGSAEGFNGSDSSGSWWEGHANWMMLQYLNTYPQAAGYIYNGMYYPSHGRDYYDSFMIWEAAREDARYGAAWVNSIWTNATPAQRTSEFIIDRMIRLDTSGSPDKAGAMKDLWGDMAKKLVTWDFERKQWLAQANKADDGTDWEFYQRTRTPLVKMAGAPGWFRPAREHAPMQYGFNIIPLTATAGTTVSCNFQPQSDPVRQGDWRACLVAVNAAGDASYSTLWNVGTNSITLSADQTKLYLVVIATPKPMKIAEPVWNAYLTDAGLQFPYAVAFTNASPRTVSYPVQSRTGMVQHAKGGGWKSSTATVDATAFIGPNAQVLNSAQVRGNARIEDFAVVRDSAQVRDNAVVSGRAEVRENAQVYGNAKVRDWGRVFGFARVFGNAKVIEHANCGDGDSGNYTQVSGEAVMKGTTYVYSGSNFSGSLIVDGDSANGATASNGVHFGWGWGNDTARFSALTPNNHLYAQHTFEKDNAVFAMDELGINHGFLMNGARVALDTVAPARGGRVLPLDGTSQYVELHHSVNDFKDSTFAVWLKWNGGASDQRVWSLGDGGNRVMWLTPSGSTGALRFTITDGTTTQTLTGPTIAPNTWKHVAVVFSGTTCTLYVDGAAVSTNTAMTLFPDSLNAPFMENANYLGRGNTGDYFAGRLDDFRVVMKALSATEVAAIFNTAAPATITPTTDSTAPSGGGWLVAPTAVDDSTVTMSAVPGSDASGWVEYYFDCISGSGEDSGWVSFNKYIDAGLTPGSTATYAVRMRDRAGNVSAPSASASVTAQTSSAGSASFAYGPIGIADGQITMTAAKLTSPSGKVEYKFDRSSPTAASSGWRSSPSWTQTGLSVGASFSYTVTVRDGRGNVSTASAPVSALARDDAGPLLPMASAHWAMQPYATIDNKVSMTAQTTTDPSGVRYFFECVSGNGPNSAWQTSPTFVTTSLPDGTYIYRYKVRDASTRSNESTWSVAYPAKITPTTGYHSVTLAQTLAAADDALVSFPAAVIRVNPTSYLVKDLASGQTIPVKPNTLAAATDAQLLFRNVTVKGHRYTFGTEKRVTFATVTSTGTATSFTLSGNVTDTLGRPISGAIVSFSDVVNASTSPIITATTDANGNYSKAIPLGTWYVSAGAATHNTSADRTVTLSSANVTGINFQLVANATVRGKVTRRSDGAALAGASIFFSRSPGASVAPVFTVTTDASGNYAQPVQNGTWYVAAGAANFYPSADLQITVGGTDLSGLHFSLKSSVRSIPRTADLLFSAITDSLPASGAAGNWPSYLPAGETFSALSSPLVEMIGGVKWINHSYPDADGFLRSTHSTAIAVNGVSVVVAVKPRRNTTDTSWTSVVDLFYNRVVLGIRNSTGRLDVWRNGNLFTSTTAVPDGQVTILSLVIQPDGQFKAYANGVQMISSTATSAMTSLAPNVAGPYANAINIGRNNPDGWSAFNGHIGDVFVHKIALSDVERQQLEADLALKFQSSDYTITASAGVGGVINPTGSVTVAPGGAQTFTITPQSGYRLSNVLVNGASQGALTSYSFSNVSANRTISAAFAALTASEQWRITHFGTHLDSGTAADNADPERDGLENLAEYAIGSNPNTFTNAPVVSMTGNRLVLTFTRNTAATDVTLTVRAADSPSGPWTDLARSVNGAATATLLGGTTVTESPSGAVRNVEVRDLYLSSDPAHPRRFMRLQFSR